MQKYNSNTEKITPRTGSDCIHAASKAKGEITRKIAAMPSK
jgi:hypothetical protein